MDMMCSNFYVHKGWCGLKEQNDFWTEPEFQAVFKWVAEKQSDLKYH
jgi:hypothetical protein